MLVFLAAIHQPTPFEVGDDLWVGILDPHAAKLSDCIDEATIRSDGLQHRQAVFFTDFHVVGTESGCHVHDAGAIFGADEIACDHVCILLLDRQKGIQRPIVQTDEIFALHTLDDAILLTAAQHLFDQRLCKDQLLGAAIRRRTFELHIVHIFAHSEGDVRRQSPGCRRPNEEVDAFLVAQREAHVNAGVFDRAIAQRHFVTAERGAAARAVRDDFLAFVEQILRPELLENPPHALDVIVGEGHIGIIEIHPEGDALGLPLPICDVSEHACLTAFVEFGDAVFLDLLFMCEAQLLLDLDFDRKAVCIPAPLAQAVIAAHRLIARKHVLERARQHVMAARLPVRGRRPLVKHIARSTFALAHRALENALCAPILELFEFKLLDIDLRIDCPEHAQLRVVRSAVRYRNQAVSSGDQQIGNQSWCEQHPHHHGYTSLTQGK